LLVALPATLEKKYSESTLSRKHHVDKKNALVADLQGLSGALKYNTLPDNLKALATACGVTDLSKSVEPRIIQRMVFKRLLQDYVTVAKYTEDVINKDDGKFEYRQLVSLNGGYLKILDHYLKDAPMIMHKDEKVQYLAAKAQVKLLRYMKDQKVNATHHDYLWVNHILHRIQTISDQLGTEIPLEKRAFYDGKRVYDADMVTDDLMAQLLKEESILAYEDKSRIGKTKLHKLVVSLVDDFKEDAQRERVASIRDNKSTLFAKRSTTKALPKYIAALEKRQAVDDKYDEFDRGLGL
jgi:hypothetical protein